MIKGGSTVVVRDCTFQDAYTPGDGGAIAVIGLSNAEIIRSTFERCVAGSYGGSVASKSGSTVVMSMCSFTESYATGGGTISAAYGEPVTTSTSLRLRACSRSCADTWPIAGLSAASRS